MEISLEQLAAALADVTLTIKGADVDFEGRHYGPLDAPGPAADLIWSILRRHEDDDVVDAHICCEHVAATRASHELRIVDQIVALLDHRGERFTKRVLRWVWDYLTDDDEPPF